MGDRVQHHAEGDLRSRYHGGGGPVGGHGDAAIVGIVMDRIAADEVVAAGSGFIGDENASRVMLGFVAHDRRVIYPHEMNALAAVFAFVGFKSGNAGTRRGGNIEGPVVVEHMVVNDGDVGGIGNEDAFEVCVANLEARYQYPGYARIGS